MVGVSASYFLQFFNGGSENNSTQVRFYLFLPRAPAWIHQNISDGELDRCPGGLVVMMLAQNARDDPKLKH